MALPRTAFNVNHRRCKTLELTPVLALIVSTVQSCVSDVSLLEKLQSYFRFWYRWYDHDDDVIFGKGRNDVTMGVESCGGLVELCCLHCGAGCCHTEWSCGRAEMSRDAIAASSCFCFTRPLFTEDQTTETGTHLPQLLVFRRRLNGTSAEQVAKKIIKKKKKKKKSHQRTRSQKLISISVWSWETSGRRSLPRDTAGDHSTRYTVFWHRHTHI